MKKNASKFLLLILLTCINLFSGFAQINPDSLKKYLLQKSGMIKPELIEFYSSLHYQAVWFSKSNTISRTVFLNALKQSADLGLRQQDYQPDYFNDLLNRKIILKNWLDSMEADIRFSDAALNFYSDIAHGNTIPSFGYNGLNYKPACINISGLLATNIISNSLQQLPGALQPDLPEIHIILAKISWINAIIANEGFKEIRIISNKVNSDNKALLSKLYQLGISDSLEEKIADTAIKTLVKKAQYQFDLLPDGVLRSILLHELNVPLSSRLEQLNLSLNYYRWLYCLAQIQPVIVVNIPAAYLKVYQGNKSTMEMRMVVGKISTPTPTLASIVNEVVLYPYWHVPRSIATKELLPVIKRNPGLIDAGNYQLLNSRGQIVDPYAVNWPSLSASNFPYLIRQSTGCDNALGLLKLNFYNPFGVYLHDTNNKNAFTLKKRYLSHGCMRMQQPMELRHLALKSNRIAIDTLEQKGCLRNQSPITVPASIHMPVIVWYNPVGIDSTGRLLFFEDVYKKFRQ